MNSITKIFYTILGSILLLPHFVNAQGGNITVDFSRANPIRANNIYQLVAAILDFVVKVGAVVVVFFIIYSGFLFVVAQGNDEKISKAKSTFMWTIIGALILLGASVLSQVVCNTANQLGASVSCGR